MDEARVLVVAQDDDLREAVTGALADLGLIVLGATDLAAAESALASLDFSVVLADRELVASSEQAARLARLRTAARPATFGVMTGVPGDSAEASFTLVKPFGLDALLTVVSEHLSRRTVEPADRAAVLAYFAALTRRDWDAVAALCSPDVVYHVPGGDPHYSRTVRGREAFRELTARTFADFPDTKFEVQKILALPHGVVARYRSRWPVGDTIAELDAAVFFELSGGLISSIGVRIDPDRILGSQRNGQSAPSRT